MRSRYLAAWCPGGVPAPLAVRIRNAAQAAGLVPARDRADLLVVAKPGLPVLDAGGGVILGTLFQLGSTATLVQLSEAQAVAVTSTRGARLIDHHWGAWVALLPDATDRLDLLRAPLGDLGCYHMPAGRALLVGSDAAILREAQGAPLTINWQALARHLGRAEIMGSETCRRGVRELRGGDRRAFGGTSEQTESLWSPWTRTAPPRNGPDPIECARRVRDAVLLAVRASASGYDRVVLSLSGGLDSSIVAACLAASNTPFTCFNLVSEDPVGDERHYARIAAAAAGVPLVEAFRAAGDVDLSRSLGALLPRPGARVFTQASERIARDVAAAHGAGAIFDGGGGDNLFCSHRSVAAVADTLLGSGFGPEFRATARALGDLGQTGMLAVALRAMRRAWLRPVASPGICDTSLLSPAAARDAVARAEHDWLHPPKGELPGKAVHVGLLATAQSLVESTHAPQAVHRVSPLISQPVAEACLPVPSALWFAPGQDRATARRAFATLLPSEIIDRRSKGTPAGFAVDLLRFHAATLRPLLLDGRLAGQGVIDCDAVRALLDDPAPSRGYGFTRLLQLVDTEAWARSWA